MRQGMNGFLWRQAEALIGVLLMAGVLAAVASPPRHGGNLRGYLARVLRNLLQLQQRGHRRRLVRELALLNEQLGLDEA